MEDLRALGGILGSYKRFGMELPEGFPEELTAAKVEHQAKKIMKASGVDQLTEQHIEEIGQSLRGGRPLDDDKDWMTDRRLNQIIDALKALQ